MKITTYMGKYIQDMRGEFCRGSWNPKTQNWDSEPCHWWVKVWGYNKDFLTLKEAKEYIKKHTGKCPSCGETKFLICDGETCEDCLEKLEQKNRA
jgi:hypothetical protein